MWGNGAAFDNVVLRNAFERAHLTPPWNFRQDMCYRTIKTLFPDVEMPERVGKHNALEDAKWQAQHLIAINKRYGFIQTHTD
jgi:hypothetical protein